MQLKTACTTHIKILDNTLLYLKTHPGIINILPEVFSKIFLKSDINEFKEEIDLKKNIGFTSLKKVKQIKIDDEDWFALRNNRKMMSRIYFSSNQEPTSIVSIILKKNENATWNLITAWFGKMAPKEPWDSTLDKNSKEFKESIKFWCNHALLYDKSVMGKPEKKTWKEILEM